MSKHRIQFSILQVVLVTALCGLAAGWLASVGRLAEQGNPVGTALPVGIPWAMVAIHSLGFLIWAVVWGLLLRRQARARIPHDLNGPVRKKLPASVESALHPLRAWAKLVTSFAVLHLPLAWLLSGWFQTLTGWPYVLSLSLLAILLPLTTIVILVSWATARQRMTRATPVEAAKLVSRAADIVGLTPRTVEFGNVQAHFFGPSQIELTIQEEYEATRRRFSEFVGEEVNPDRPLLVLVFEEKEHLDSYMRGQLPFEGLYWRTPYRQILMSERGCLAHLREPLSIFRSLVGTYLLEQYKGELSASWIQLAMTRQMAADPAAVAKRANRVLRTWMLTSRRSYRVPLLTASERELSQHLLVVDRLEDYQRATYSVNQIISFGAFLLGDETEARHEPFRRFLGDVKGSDRGEAILQQHFGFGFDAMIDQWRKWSLAQPIDPCPTMPSILLRHFRTIMCPLILDANAPIRNRIEAVRAIGASGYEEGSRVLVHLLQQHPPVELASEAEWALQTISATAHTGVDEWQAWWQESAEKAPSKTQASADPLQADRDDGIFVAELAAEVGSGQNAGKGQDALVRPPGVFRAAQGLLAAGGSLAVIWPVVMTALLPTTDEAMAWALLPACSIAAGVFSLVNVVSGEGRRLKASAKMLGFCLFTCNVLTAISGVMAYLLLHRVQVQQYLRQQTR